MEKIREINRRRLPLIEAVLQEHCEDIASWVPDNLNYHMWLEFPANINTRKIFTDCRDYLYFPGQLFGSNNHVFINNVCESVESTVNCIKAVADAARRQI